MDLKNLKESCGHIEGYDKKLSILSVCVQHLSACVCVGGVEHVNACVWGGVRDRALVCGCMCNCDYVALHIHVEIVLPCHLSYCIISYQ